MVRTLVLDIGNTALKAGFFDEAGLLVRVARALTVADLRPDVVAFGPARVLVASVAASAAVDVGAALGLPPAQVLAFGPDTPLPIQLAYDTPRTLGADRVAAAVGAQRQFPGTDILILDAGTCLKADLLTADGIFRGGAISPGLAMRFRALEAFTGRLPLVALASEPAADALPPWPGSSTAASIQAGVARGLMAEAAAFVVEAAARYPGLRVVLSGGDARWLAQGLPLLLPTHLTGSRTFALEPDLVLLGLHRILQRLF